MEVSTGSLAWGRGFSPSAAQRRGLRHSGHLSRACCIVCVSVFWVTAARLREKVVFNSNSCLGVMGSFILGGGGSRATNDVYKLSCMQFLCKPLSSREVSLAARLLQWPQRAWRWVQAGKRGWDKSWRRWSCWWGTVCVHISVEGCKRGVELSWNPLQLAGTKPLKSSLKRN